jgi:4-amino-4-deoxy-L-arabinose transferase-like glycosyltransferase
VEFVRFAAGALASFVLVFATALAAGAWLRRRIVGELSLAHAALDAALGFGIVGTALLGLGLLHLLRVEVLLPLAAVIHAAAAGWWRRTACDVWATARRASWATRTLAIGFGLWLAPLVALSLYPPTAYDATAYHLPYARAFARDHAVSFLADVQPPIYPQLTELLFTAGLLGGPDVVAHLLQLSSTVLIALLVLGWDPVPRPARVWAAALWLGIPHVVWMSGAAYVDLGMTLSTTAAVYAWHRARQDEEGSTGWWAIAGACAGFAAATKYLGLFFVAAGAAAAAVEAVRRRRAAPLVTFAAVAAAAAGPWYVRLYLETGNPLFPHFTGWFRGADASWSLEWASRRWSLDLGAAGATPARRVPEGLWFLVLTPWNALVHRELFAWQAPLTPYYLVLLPLLPIVAVARRWARPLLLLAGAYAIAWLAVTPRDLRYLLPLWPLLNLAVMEAGACAVARSRGLVFRPAAVLVVAAMLVAPGVAYAGYRLVRQGPLPVTPEAREAYLTRWVPGHAAIAWLNRRHGANYGVYALYGVRLTYYAEGRFHGRWIGPAPYAEIVPLVKDPAALDGALDGLGVQYLLLVSDLDMPAPEPPATPEWRARFVPVLTGPEFVLYRRTAA